MKGLRVYLSSTFEDLKDYRAAVFAALEKAGLDVARMEAYTAADERPLDLCLRDVAESDVYVGLYAWRHGYVPPAEHGNPQFRSITELEYRQAASQNLRKLLFFTHPQTKADWPERFKDEATGQGDGGKKLDALRKELGTEKSASFFRTPDELATLVLAAIMRRVDDWERMIDVNIKGVLYGIAAALPHMQRQKSGHIINVSSVAGHKVRPAGAVYAATKHAVRALSEGLRQEVKPYNIRTTLVSPGAIATELPNSTTEPDIAAGVRKLYELAIPADSFARAVVFAMSQPDDIDVNEILFRPTRQEV